MGVGFTASHLKTIGADFAQKKITFDNEENQVVLQIWDVAGQEDFRDIRQRYLLHANICLMVFDLSRKNTLHSITKWMHDFWEMNPKGDIPLVIIGNKADLEDQIQVTTEEIESMINLIRDAGYSTSNHISFIRTSAATGMNIEQAFMTVARQITNIYIQKYT